MARVEKGVFIQTDVGCNFSIDELASLSALLMKKSALSKVFYSMMNVIPQWVG